MTAQAQFADQQPELLDGAEISNLLRTMQAAQFNKSELISPKDTSFKPRSLVEIAQEAEQKRKEEHARRAAEFAVAEAQTKAEAAQKAEQEAAENTAEGSDAENASDAGPGDATGEIQSETPSEPVSEIEVSEAQIAPENPAEVPTITAQQLEDKLAEAEASLRAEFAAEKKALEESLTETHYHRGFDAGMNAAKTAEPSDEEKAHIAHQEAERADIIARFNAIIASASQMDAVDSRALAEEMELALIRLAEERAGIAISQNPEGMVQKIRNMADNVASQAKVMDVYLNAEDKQAIEKWLNTAETEMKWRLHGAPEMHSGDIRIVIGGVELADIFTPLPDQPTHTGDAEHIQPEDRETVSEVAADDIAEPENNDVSVEAEALEHAQDAADASEKKAIEAEAEVAKAEVRGKTGDTVGAEMQVQEAGQENDAGSEEVAEAASQEQETPDEQGTDER